MLRADRQCARMAHDASSVPIWQQWASEGEREISHPIVRSYPQQAAILNSYISSCVEHESGWIAVLESPTHWQKAVYWLILNNCIICVLLWLIRKHNCATTRHKPLTIEVLADIRLMSDTQQSRATLLHNSTKLPVWHRELPNFWQVDQLNF